MKTLAWYSIQIHYKAEHEKIKGKMIQIEETPEMKLSKELHPVQSRNAYTSESKKLHPIVNIGSGMQYLNFDPYA